ncbi:MAG: phage GP46 family protein [Tagaea sp.]|nr:phage GP46 family protein [Tagaea sp.]
MDIAIAFDGETLTSDWLVANGDLSTDRGLASAVIVSLFSDARALPGDRLPEEPAPPWDQVGQRAPFANRRGFWGDAIKPPQVAAGARHVTGSRLWLLEREKILPETLARAEAYAREALAWLLDDGVARRIDVAASVVRGDWLALHVRIWQPGGLAFQKIWELPRAARAG